MYDTPVLERYGTLRELTVMLGNPLWGSLDIANQDDGDSDGDSDSDSDSRCSSC